MQVPVAGGGQAHRTRVGDLHPARERDRPLALRQVEGADRRPGLAGEGDGGRAGEVQQLRLAGGTGWSPRALGSLLREVERGLALVAARIAAEHAHGAASVDAGVDGAVWAGYRGVGDAAEC